MSFEEDSETELMLFMELDHGAILRNETGLDSAKNRASWGNAEGWLSLGTWIRKSSAFVESRRSDHTAVA